MRRAIDSYLGVKEARSPAAKPRELDAEALMELPYIIDLRWEGPHELEAQEGIPDVE